jgi:hypothetical protein
MIQVKSILFLSLVRWIFFQLSPLKLCTYFISIHDKHKYNVLLKIVYCLIQELDFLKKSKIIHDDIKLAHKMIQIAHFKRKSHKMMT